MNKKPLKDKEDDDKFADLKRTIELSEEVPIELSDVVVLTLEGLPEAKEQIVDE